MNKKMLITLIVFVCLSSAVFAQNNYGFDLIGRAVSGEAEAVFVVNDTCYLGAGNALLVFNTANPAAPVTEGFLALPDVVEDVFVIDSLAYIADGSGGLIIADISNPAQIERLGQLQFSDDAFGLYVDSSHAYIAGLDAGFIIVDIANPNFPMQLSSFPVDWAALNVDVEDTIACVASGYGGLYILDISDPVVPVQLGLIDTHNTWAYDVKIDGDYAYMAYSLYTGGGGLKTINISNPSSPQVVGDQFLGHSLRRLDYNNGYVFASSRTGGMFILDVSTPGSPQVIGGWQHGTGENIAYRNQKIFLVGAEEGLRIFNASNLYFPQHVSTFPTYSASQDVVIAGQYVYIAEQPAGMKVINISNLNSPMVTYSNSFFPEGGGSYGGVSSGISIVGNNLYVSNFANLNGGDHDFRIYGLSNPAQPESLGIYNNLNMGVRGHMVRNDYAYLSNSGSLKVLNVRYPGSSYLVFNLVGGWDSAREMDIVGNYLYLATMETGLYILDITYPDEPVIAGIFDTQGEAFDVKYHDSCAYIADYSQGLRIVNVADPANLYEVGHFIGSYEDCRSVDIIDGVDHTYAIVCFDDQIVALNIDNPSFPFEVGYFETGDPRRLRTYGDTVYVADRDYGLFIFTLDTQVGIADDENNQLPDNYFIAHNYPNPFNSSTIIEFTLPAESQVSVDIYDVLGRQITRPYSGNAQAGINKVLWNGKNQSGCEMPSGVYFYKITNDRNSIVNKVVLLK